MAWGGLLKHCLCVRGGAHGPAADAPLTTPILPLLRSKSPITGTHSAAVTNLPVSSSLAPALRAGNVDVDASHAESLEPFRRQAGTAAGHNADAVGHGHRGRGPGGGGLRMHLTCFMLPSVSPARARFKACRCMVRAAC